MDHFITIADTPTEELEHVLDVAARLRVDRNSGQTNNPVLAGKSLAMLFEKPSLRTRVSFEQAVYELGGHAVHLLQQEIGIGKRESAADIAQVLSGMVHGIMARVFEHAKLEQMAEAGSVPVINALSDDSHPCQALADIMTMRDEFGHDLSGRTLAYVGDGNNVAKSLAWMCGKLGLRFVIAAPDGYKLPDTLLETIREGCRGADVDQIDDPHQAVRDADAIYTDTFVSMGQEDEKQQRLTVFADYQVNQTLLDAAPDHVIVLHCLPAYRGVEITADVIDGPSSRVFPQAHNRLHGQKGLLAVLMGGC
ncbi:MAG: ornithine carbamoyltransferase [Phycisphaerae bacterium]|nr:ornithine carbamoyltransferase [Phycisphaerae bacterium]